MTLENLGLHPFGAETERFKNLLISFDDQLTKFAARNAQDLAGFSPLMWAAGRDSADGVKMLLDCEAVGPKSSGDEQLPKPIVWVDRFGFGIGTLVPVLLKISQADLSLKAARGQTAMTFALTNGCNAIVDILDKQQAILDAEEARRIKEKGEGRPQAEEACRGIPAIPVLSLTLSSKMLQI